jgi:hypothetical protein
LLQRSETFKLLFFGIFLKNKICKKIKKKWCKVEKFKKASKFNLTTIWGWIFKPFWIFRLEIFFSNFFKPYSSIIFQKIRFWMFRSAVTTRGKLYKKWIKKRHIEFGRHFEFLRKKIFHESYVAFRRNPSFGGHLGLCRNFKSKIFQTFFLFFSSSISIRIHLN